MTTLFVLGLLEKESSVCMAIAKVASVHLLLAGNPVL